ncbi:Undecaprenyl diphosphate synthase [Ascodesmis nigricans]|uniref:ditrans,polycis-polyprenyl diphosphate synthase [(2E,6E)-farnesyldiphosphate specific] n=1 Tax=Ascodesmis nigricans TaxID=341454 RepID=A0A4S2MT73_9PEZI|nr:Undecaprenyl diphosphate synthase [Ascodesmis nigricans]
MPSATKHRPPSPLSTSGRTSSAQLHPLKPALRKPQPRKRQPKSPEVLERERLVLSRLPDTTVPPKRKPVRQFLRLVWHRFIYLLIHAVFIIYLKLRWGYNAIVSKVFALLYYHHRTPELIQKDVQPLKEKGKFPGHISVVLDYERDDLDKLIDEVAEIACWCAAAEIKTLSVYERTGILKNYISTSHRTIADHLRSYFGRDRPTVRVHAPHSRSFANGDIPGDGQDSEIDLEVMFLSEEDGRESIVDLTKTLCDMAQRGKIGAEDVSTELIDAELKDNVMGEPDLLILFSPNVTLKGYPPWQIRLTEIFNVTDNEGVGYQVFLRALHSFAKTEFKFGR